MFKNYLEKYSMWSSFFRIRKCCYTEYFFEIKTKVNTYLCERSDACYIIRNTYIDKYFHSEIKVTTKYIYLYLGVQRDSEILRFTEIVFAKCILGKILRYMKTCPGPTGSIKWKLANNGINNEMRNCRCQKIIRLNMR